MELHRRHRRGRRSSSGRAWSEGHRRRGCRPRTGTTKTIRRRLRPPKVPLPLMTMEHRSLKSRCLRGPAVSAWRKASDRRTSRVDPLRPTTLGLTPWVVVSMSDESWQSRSLEVMAGGSCDRRRSRATDGGEGRNIPLVQRSSRTNKSNEASWRTTEMMEMRFFLVPTWPQETRDVDGSSRYGPSCSSAPREASQASNPSRRSLCVPRLVRRYLVGIVNCSASPCRSRRES